MTFRWHKPEPRRLRFLGGGVAREHGSPDDRGVEVKDLGHPADGAAARVPHSSVSEVVQSLRADAGHGCKFSDPDLGTVE